MEGMKKDLDPNGYHQMYLVIQNNSIEVFQKTEIHLKLFP